MATIKRLILGNLNLRVFLPLFALALLSTWYGLFWSKVHFEGLTGGTTFPDMQSDQTPTELLAQISTYTDETVTFYIGWSIFDYAWPLLTFTAILFISGWLLRFVGQKWTDWFGLFIASAYLTVLMDWIENAGFMVLVAARPEEPLLLAQITLAFHAAKMFFMMVFNVATWALLIAVIYRKIRGV